MEGTCDNCGCTEQRACVSAEGEPCWWIDAREDLCSQCAEMFLADQYPVGMGAGGVPLSDAHAIQELQQMVRALRRSLAGTQRALALLAPHLMMGEAIGEAVVERVVTPPSGLWLPGADGA